MAGASKAENEAFAAAVTPGASFKTYEPARVGKHRDGIPVSVIAFVASPLPLRLIWASLENQTHRPLEFVILNQAKDIDGKLSIRDVAGEIRRKSEIPLKYLESLRRVNAVRLATNDTVLLVDSGSIMEPGHIESLANDYHKGSRKISSSRVLGEYGGFDDAEILKNSRVTPQILGSFLMSKREILSTLRKLRSESGGRRPMRISSLFIKEYMRLHMPSGAILPTGSPTHIILGSKR